MKLPLLFSLALVLFGAAAAPAQTTAPTTGPTTRPFTVYDGILNYEGRPASGWPTAFGVANFCKDWPIKANSEVDPIKCREWGRKALAAKAGLIYLDDSWPTVWPIDIRTAKLSEVASTCRKLADAVRLIREGAEGKIPVGIYGLPLRSYHANSDVDEARFAVTNGALTELLSGCDIILPDLYCFYAEQSTWPQYAQRAVVQSRKYGKPVMPFVWPRVHESNLSVPKGEYIDAADWRMILEWVKANADGVVIWDSATPYNRSPRWDASYPWWRVTQEVLR